MDRPSTSNSFIFSICAMAGAAILALSGVCSSQADEPVCFYVSPEGNDRYSGRIEAPNADATDGPFATITQARDAVRVVRAAEPQRQASFIIYLRGGIYYLDQAFTLSPEDSGTTTSPTIFRNYAGEKPILSGGRRLTGWRQTSDHRWTLSIPDAASGSWNFSQLFVNGERRYRPHLPRTGYYQVASQLPAKEALVKSRDRFWFYPGDIKGQWADPTADIELICFHSFNGSLQRLAEVNENEHLARLTGPVRMLMSKGDRYLVDNVQEAFGDLGQWYLDRASGILTYIPKPGEKLRDAEIVAPRLETLVRFEGDPATHHNVDHIQFEGIGFAHTNWLTPAKGYGFAQADAILPAAISFKGARSCSLRDCSISHLGAYGVAFREGCHDNLVENCDISDMGAGGILIGALDYYFAEPKPPTPLEPDLMTTSQTIRNCRIAHGGRIHPGAVGIWVGQSAYNTLSHNDIYDLYYTGISVGWTWGYGPSLAHHNIIEFNHIYDCCQGVLGDVGLIYTLGHQPGTVIRNNLLHDMDGRLENDGNGIYLDEGSSDMLVENNIVYHVRGEGLHENYGANNTIRNNIFALCGHWGIDRARPEDHLSFKAEHNIFYSSEGEIAGGSLNPTGQYDFLLDHNLYWKTDGTMPLLYSKTFDAWKTASGMDAESLVANPLFGNPDKGDFSLAFNSPALLPPISFNPIDAAKCGRLDAKGQAAAVQDRRDYPSPAVLRRVSFYLDPSSSFPIYEDFEAVAIGDKPNQRVSVEEESPIASIRVTDEASFHW